jgi:hypothetical protein
MKHINQRNIRIVDELMSFCYKYGASKLEIEVDSKKNEIIIIVKAHVKHFPKETLVLANNLLSAPRCREMEEYYWNLSGDDDTDTELTLIGMMTDEAEVNYINEKLLEIKLKRLI